MSKHPHIKKPSKLVLAKITKILLFLGCFCFLVLGGIVIYFEMTAQPSFDSPEVDPKNLYSEQDGEGTPDEGDAKVVDESAVEAFTIKGTIAKGSTAGGLLQTWLEPQQLHSFLAASEKVYSLKNVRAGQPFTVVHNATSGLERFEYEIDNDRKLIVLRGESDYSAVLEEIAYDIKLMRIEGVINSSLFESMATIGESPALAVNLADIFAWEINFIRDIKEGDSYKLLVEKRFREGEEKGYGTIFAAEFTNQGKAYAAYSFKEDSGKLNYYTRDGESVKRAFLKAPLSFTRISSRFTNRRFHPILQTWRSHPAIDYAAPTGTPVKAIGSGTVIFKGWGKGAGNYITLRHFGGYESMYLHLSGFARSLQKGKKVSQGEVIGFVGSTGYSTGPHLDFRMKKNGQFINPEKNLSPRAEPIKGLELKVFQNRCDQLAQYLAGEKNLTEYTKDMW